MYTAKASIRYKKYNKDSLSPSPQRFKAQGLALQCLLVGENHYYIKAELSLQKFQW